jgi:hypothetical protein
MRTPSRSTRSCSSEPTWASWPARRRRPVFLNALARLAASDAVILGRGMDPFHTLMQAHRAYHERNRALGRLPGQIRLRVRYQNLATPWFDYLFASVEEIIALLDGSAWMLKRCETAGAGYLAMLQLRD